MLPIHRKQFLQKLGLLAFVSAILPEFLLAGTDSPKASPCKPVSDPPDPKFGIIDMHIHPSMKMWLWNEKFWQKHYPIPGGNFLHMQVDERTISAGYIKGMLATHYLLEIGISKKSSLLRHFYGLLGPGIKSRFENDDYSNFTQITDIMDVFELQMHNQMLLNEKAGNTGTKLVLARSFKEFKQIWDEGKIPMAHAIEGAHALGRNLHHSSIKRYMHRHTDNKMVKDLTESAEIRAGKYIENLLALKERGVCQMTLCHFFPNDIVTTVTEGISYDEEKVIGFKYVPKDPEDKGLSPIGKVVVDKMFEIGMIVDLTHSSKQTRKDVFEINERRAKRGEKLRPVVFSHVGIRELFTPPAEVPERFGLYDVTPEEIRHVSDCRGLIGVLAENFWLTGCDTHLPGCKGTNPSLGVANMVNTMIHINRHTKGDFDNVAIGSDFDGLADAPSDLYTPSQFGRLINEMRLQGINDSQIEKITNGNAMRVLEEGWGNKI